jgi:hypothetical protein
MKNKNIKSIASIALVSILLISSVSVTMMINSNGSAAYGLILTLKTGKKLDTGKSFDKQMAANATTATKVLASHVFPKAKNVTDYCVTKAVIIGLFNGMCDTAISLIFELCQIGFVNASYTECRTDTSIHKWMTYRNLTDDKTDSNGQTDLITWDFMVKQMKGQINKNGF